MSQRSGWDILCHKLQNQGVEESPRVLLLAAHPDDETIGASCVLGRISDCTIIYLTDGAPRDPRWRSPHVSGSRELYARVRAEEAASALALAGIPTTRIIFLGGVDQEAIYQVQRLEEDFSRIIRGVQPGVIITHAYEGGHPDHDTAALVVRLALRRSEHALGSAPELVEMTSYHAVNGRRVSGEFLACAGGSANQNEPLVLRLSAAERAIKARMFGCYVSQWPVLSEFPLEPESFRIAPAYDFSQPPHEGSLWYECLHWPLTGARWRELASAAVSQCGEPACH